MRTEDLSGVPESIEAWRVGEMLEELGFKPVSYKSVAEIRIEPRQVVVTAYATDENGRRFMVDADQIEVTDLGSKDPAYVPGSGGTAAVHVVAIPLVGGWEPPTSGDSPQA